MIVNEICLKKLFTYSNSVYQIGEKINKLERSFKKSASMTKTSAVTGAKLMMVSCLCGNRSINELILTIHNKETKFDGLFTKKEYIPKMHGLRDYIKNTNYKQIEEINDSVIRKIKENKVFKKNLIDGLVVCATDGHELNETIKDIENLPEREHIDGEIKKYIKYLVSAIIGPKANFIVNVSQLTEREKITTKTGKMKAKTIGETTSFLENKKFLDKKIGRNVDVHVLDALYLNAKVMNCINDDKQFFVIRMEDKTKHIYKDAKGIFDNSKAKEEYEIVEITKEIEIKYTKVAKRKDVNKTKIVTEKRKITSNKLGERYFVSEKESCNRKNSVKKVKIYEKVIRRVEVWDEEGFEYASYKGNLRVIRSKEKYKYGKEIKEQEVYIVTDMINHKRSTIITIMHYRWNIENCCFRKLNQEYKMKHIFIGDFNSINYIVQMIILVSNLLELYLKIRSKETIKVTYIIRKKLFEKQFQTVNF